MAARSVRQPVDFAFLDSGTGGIPYMLHLKKKLPASRCVYLADNANFPYGTKSRGEIVECATEACGKIIGNFCPRALVIACNTISVTALEVLRERFSSVPIVGTVPAIKLAASVTRNRKIGLLATSATVRNDYTEKLRREFAAGCELVCRGDDKLVGFVEHEFFEATENEKLSAVKPAIEFFKQKNCDTVILGCTHFLHLADTFQKAAGAAVTIVDSREGVAKQAVRVSVQGFSGNTAAGENPKPAAVYVSGFAKENDAAEYGLLCERLGLEFCGALR